MLDIRKELESAKTIGIAGHVRPDGDCVGSAAAVYGYLKLLFPEKRIDLYLEAFNEAFLFLKGVGEARRTLDETVSYDGFVVVDCAAPERIGVAGEAFKKAGRTVVIDHHISNPGYGDVFWVDADASSTSEMVYRLIDKKLLNKDLAESIYMGIVHDTGVFQYSNTSKETLEAAAFLVEQGIDSARIIDETFYQKTYEQNLLLGRTLLASQLMLDGRCIVSAVSREEMELYGIVPKDFEGIVNQLRITKGVEVAVLMYEIEPGVHKVSFRSNKEADVNKIAEKFGGGGHVKAAGCSIEAPVWEAIARIVQAIEAELNG